MTQTLPLADQDDYNNVVADIMGDEVELYGDKEVRWILQ